MKSNRTAHAPMAFEDADILHAKVNLVEAIKKLITAQLKKRLNHRPTRGRGK
jgi:hypothetical protein